MNLLLFLFSLIIAFSFQLHVLRGITLDSQSPLPLRNTAITVSLPPIPDSSCSCPTELARIAPHAREQDPERGEPGFYPPPRLQGSLPCDAPPRPSASSSLPSCFSSPPAAPPAPRRTTGTPPSVGAVPWAGPVPGTRSPPTGSTGPPTWSGRVPDRSQCSAGRRRGL